MNKITNGRTAKQIGYLAFLIIGAQLAAASGGNHDLAAEVGALIAAWLIVGAIGYAMARLRKTGASWRQVTTGRWALIMTLLLLSITAAAHQAGHHR